MGPLSQEPGIIPIVAQTSLFERGVAAGRSIEIELTGPDLKRLVGMGGRVFGQVMQMFPGAQARPIPSLDLANPQVHIVPDRERLAELGLSVAELGRAVDVFIDGTPVSTYELDGEEIDLTLMGWPELAARTQGVGDLRIFTPAGRLVSIASVAEVRSGTGPEEIRRVESERAITVQLIPPATVPLEQAAERVEQEVIGPLRAQGALQPPYGARLMGTADDLRQILQTLRGDFLLAIAIAFLLMAALFESFLYPLVIMFSVPLAAVGGFLGLRLVNLFTYQPMDILTMLGFIILVGVVVNNAILIVHQALNLIREGRPHREAIVESVRTRVRPIFMSTSTSVFGMLPLIVMPGAGSELYRGLGSVVVGGLVVSTIFTLFLIPALFSLVLDARAAVARWRGAAEPETA
jgi:HAE1 family hydrophobic/amphiphilic exporter-1